MAGPTLAVLAFACVGPRKPPRGHFGGGNFFRRPHLHRERSESADSRDRGIAPRTDAGISHVYY